MNIVNQMNIGPRVSPAQNGVTTLLELHNRIEHPINVNCRLGDKGAGRGDRRIGIVKTDDMARRRGSQAHIIHSSRADKDMTVLGQINSRREALGDIDAVAVGDEVVNQYHPGCGSEMVLHAEPELGDGKLIECADGDGRGMRP